MKYNHLTVGGYFLLYKTNVSSMQSSPEVISMGLDYRDMDILELDSNIPQGRGMIKWALFATMLEQYERVAEMIQDQTKTSAPTYDNEALVMLEEELHRLIEKTLVLHYWNDGFEVQVECKVEYISDASGMVVVSKGAEAINIRFEHIYEII